MRGRESPVPQSRELIMSCEVSFVSDLISRLRRSVNGESSGQSESRRPPRRAFRSNGLAKHLSSYFPLGSRLRNLCIQPYCPRVEVALHLASAANTHILRRSLFICWRFPTANLSFAASDRVHRVRYSVNSVKSFGRQPPRSAAVTMSSSDDETPLVKGKRLNGGKFGFSSVDSSYRFHLSQSTLTTCSLQYFLF